MNNDTNDISPEVTQLVKHELEDLGKHWWWFLVLGVLLTIGGVAAIAYPFITSSGVVILLGAVLIVAGIVTVIGAFWAGKWSAFFLQVLVGILYVMAGMAIRDAPVESAVLLTMFMAAFFIVAGAFRIVVSLVVRFPQWGWALLNGIVTLLAGIIIYDVCDKFPTIAISLIGLLVGLELLFNGWTWIMLAVSLRGASEEIEKIEEVASQ